MISDKLTEDDAQELAIEPACCAPEGARGQRALEILPHRSVSVLEAAEGAQLNAQELPHVLQDSLHSWPPAPGTMQGDTHTPDARRRRERTTNEP